MFWKKQKRTNIKAVDDEDFSDFLIRIGVHEIIEEGKAKCKVCGQTLNLNTIDMVFPEQGQVSFVCSKPKCLIIFTHEKNEVRE